MSLMLENLALWRGPHCLARLDAEIAPAEILTLMGPSGVGKSSLLAAILGALPPGLAATGAVWLNGRNLTGLPPHLRQIGLQFQDDVLFPHLSVAGNLGFALPPRLRPAKARRARIEAALAEAGLAGFADRDPATLSGGQRARVALLRSLLAEPRALLLDEPFARLDAGLREQIRSLTFSRARALGLPVLLVTHDAEDARAAEGRIITLG